MENRETVKDALTKRRRAVFELLRIRKCSAADITMRTGFCDPRSHIRELRKLGIRISDEWRKGEDGIRYKLYFVKDGK